jgi:hypothetical protein
VTVICGSCSIRQDFHKGFDADIRIIFDDPREGLPASERLRPGCIEEVVGKDVDPRLNVLGTAPSVGIIDKAARAAQDQVESVILLSVLRDMDEKTQGRLAAQQKIPHHKSS